MPLEDGYPTGPIWSVDSADFVRLEELQQLLFILSVITRSYRHESYCKTLDPNGFDKSDRSTYKT